MQIIQDQSYQRPQEPAVVNLHNKNAEVEAQVLDLNRKAMWYLQKNQFAKGRQLLDQAIQTIAEIGDKSTLAFQLLGLTHNNIGCFYKHQEDFDEALRHLQLALSYEVFLQQSQSDINHSVGTILNIGAIYSLQNRHKKAFGYAQQAIQKLNLVIDNDLVMIGQQLADQQIIGTGAIAYYNMAVEAEYLGLFNEAKTGFDMSLLLSNKLKGQNKNKQKVTQALDSLNIKVKSTCKKRLLYSQMNQDQLINQTARCDTLLSLQEIINKLKQDGVISNQASERLKVAVSNNKNQQPNRYKKFIDKYDKFRFDNQEQNQRKILSQQSIRLKSQTNDSPRTKTNTSHKKRRSVVVAWTSASTIQNQIHSPDTKQREISSITPAMTVDGQFGYFIPSSTFSPRHKSIKLKKLSSDIKKDVAKVYVGINLTPRVQPNQVKTFSTLSKPIKLNHNQTQLMTVDQQQLVLNDYKSEQPLQQIKSQVSMQQKQDLKLNQQDNQIQQSNTADETVQRSSNKSIIKQCELPKIEIQHQLTTQSQSSIQPEQVQTPVTIIRQQKDLIIQHTIQKSMPNYVKQSTQEYKFNDFITQSQAIDNQGQPSISTVTNKIRKVNGILQYDFIQNSYSSSMTQLNIKKQLSQINEVFDQSNNKNQAECANNADEECSVKVKQSEKSI